MTSSGPEMLYLVRHGKAEQGSDDAARRLTRKGREEVAAIARVVAATGVQVPAILHSGRRRALETAELWAAALTPSPAVEARTGLDPMTDPAEARALVDQAEDALMIVGHLPHLGRLASLLVTGDSGDETVVLPTGAVVALERESGIWRIRWLLTPKLARAVDSGHDDG